MRPVDRHHPEKILSNLILNANETNGDIAGVTPIFYMGVVEEYRDPKKMNRVKVRLYGIDRNTSRDNLPWCISMMPSFFHVIPKTGELVFVLLRNPWNNQLGRYYFGPIYGGELNQNADEANEDLGFNLGG